MFGITKLAEEVNSNDYPRMLYHLPGEDCGPFIYERSERDLLSVSIMFYGKKEFAYIYFECSVNGRRITEKAKLSIDGKDRVERLDYIVSVFNRIVNYTEDYFDSGCIDKIEYVNDVGDLISIVDGY